MTRYYIEMRNKIIGISEFPVPILPGKVKLAESKELLIEPQSVSLDSSPG